MVKMSDLLAFSTQSRNVANWQTDEQHISYRALQHRKMHSNSTTEHQHERFAKTTKTYGR